MQTKFAGFDAETTLRMLCFGVALMVPFGAFLVSLKLNRLVPVGQRAKAIRDTMWHIHSIFLIAALMFGETQHFFLSGFTT